MNSSQKVEQLAPQAGAVMRPAAPIERALHDAMFNSALFSCIATDVDGGIQIFNVGAERMLGYLATEVVNQISLTTLLEENALDNRTQGLRLETDVAIEAGFEVIVYWAARGFEDSFEMTFICKDGRHFLAMVALTPLRDAQEAVIGYLLTVTRHAARKLAEQQRAQLDQQLRDQQFYTRSIIEANVDALMATDPYGIISDVNREMEHLTGLSRTELIGSPFKQLFTDPIRAEAGMMHVLLDGKITNYELIAQARDGTHTAVSYNARTFYNRDQKLQGVLASAHDVTNSKHFEDLLIEKNLSLESARVLAEKANKAKSEFLSSMSHELRTPLNAVLGFAQLLISDTPAPTEDQKASIEQILQAGWYLLGLINEILDLTAIESGKMRLLNQSTSLHELLQDCEAMLHTKAHRRGISMRFPDVAQDYHVYADQTRLKQVMVNLLSNAIKYNRAGGTVDVACTVVGAGYLRISVVDTGNGLSPEQLSQLFQPFNRLGQESGSEEGTGIGLVVTKQLVELMRGRVGVSSRTGIGSCFWVELPLAVLPALQHNAGSPTSVPLPLSVPVPETVPVRILLYVDDSKANLILIQQLIARRGDLMLMCAADAFEGIALARAHQPDLILMDLNLPGMSGMEALAVLRADPLTALIPVAALTANAMQTDIDECLRAGFCHYLIKPIKFGEFMTTIDQILQDHAPP